MSKFTPEIFTKIKYIITILLATFALGQIPYYQVGGRRKEKKGRRWNGVEGMRKEQGSLEEREGR